MKRANEQGGAAALAQVLIRAMTARPLDPPSAAVQLAVFCGAAGHIDDAFTYLDQAVASRDPALVHLGVAPQWDTLRHDRRFTALLQDLKLPS
jgi:CBS-domain-containing membrane protein